MSALACLTLLFHGSVPGAPALEANAYLIPPTLSQPEFHQQESTMTMSPSPRILFWNMQWFPAAPDGSVKSSVAGKKIRASAAMLKTSDADLIFLCEVLDLESLTRMQLPYPFQACTNIERHPEDTSGLPPQNLALLSRTAPEKTWVLDFEKLPETPDRPSRGILAAQFRLDSGQLLTCYTLHLKSNLGGYQSTGLRRERAIDYLAHDLERVNLHPEHDWILIAGDMNTSPEDPLFREERTLPRLEQLGFERLGKKHQESLKSGGRADRTRLRFHDFDHLFLSGALIGHLKSSGHVPHVETRPITPADLSDHDIIELELTGLDRPRSTP